VGRFMRSGMPSERFSLRVFIKERGTSAGKREKGHR
jgi:hypothetical protein